MSGQATGWVLRHGPAPDMLDRFGKPYGGRARGLRSVLVTVADACNRDGEHGHPGVAAICDGSLYGRRQAAILLAELVAEGWLAIEEEGGGRGRATVYGIPRMKSDEETAQPVRGSRGGNRAVSDAKPRTLETETAHSGGSAPITSTESNVEANGGAVAALDGDEVRSVLDAWWEERRDAGNPVGQKYIACLGVVRSMAKQGVPLNRIAYALRHAPVVSAGALEMAIQQRLQSDGARDGPPGPVSKSQALVNRNPGLREVLAEHLFTDEGPEQGRREIG